MNPEKSHIPGPIREDMERNRIDIDLSLRILDRWNRGGHRDQGPVRVRDIPSLDGRRVLDFTGEGPFTVPLREARDNLAGLIPGLDAAAFGEPDGRGSLVFSRAALEKLGVLLYPLLSYGILNGGSATSYADGKINRAFSGELFSLMEPVFRISAELCRDRPKGITPAYVNPDGSPGFSFIELKMRALLLGVLRRRRAAAAAFPPGRAGPGAAVPGADLPDAPPPLAPMFQMTSVFTDPEVSRALLSYGDSPALRTLIERTGIDITRVETGVQPLISAFTHSSQGERKSLFTEAGGIPGRTLGLPGGHGQNFLVLKDVYRRLRESGKRFAYLGNVDNLGYTPDPAGLALLALSGRKAAFEFSFKTAVDRKGGILVVDGDGRLNCADIGPAISPGEVARWEGEGRPILFNVATGLFDLEHLTRNIDGIIAGLPVRWSDQDKDAGRYSQAEQVTWEVLGLLDDALILGVEKSRRFLAAKLLLENFLTCGLYADDPAFPSDPNPERDLKKLAATLRSGFAWNMENNYGMRLGASRWEPVELRSPAGLWGDPL